MKFVELTLPIKDIKEQKWYVISKNIEWILKTTGVLGKLTSTPPEECLFDTEADAHIASAVFYSFFGEDYPYIVEWAAAVDTYGLEEEMASTIEQELMDFI